MWHMVLLWLTGIHEKTPGYSLLRRSMTHSIEECAMFLLNAHRVISMRCENYVAIWA